MKKKAIEKIPYLTLKKLDRKKSVEYIGMTALVEVAGERMLMLEVYRNAKGCKEIPEARVMVGQGDFGTFFPESGVWSRGKIIQNTWDDYGLIWDSDERIRKTNATWITENILASKEDLKRIQEFTKDHAVVYDQRKWWEYIDDFQRYLYLTKERERGKRQREKRQQALNDRAANTPELPEKMILDRADRIYFSRKHFLYYKKQGCWADIACSKCGGVSHGRWKRGISYESEFQKWVEEPKEGRIGHCPMCGEVGEYKCQGKAKGEHSERIHLFLGQKYKDTGLVMRYIEVNKIWNLQLMGGEKGLEMNGAYEELSGVEIARAYYMPGKKVQIDYHKRNPYSERDFWDDCNLCGLSKIKVAEAAVLPETYENMKGTMFQYSAMKEYSRTTYRYNPIDYLNRYNETPQIEMLVKMGLTGVVSSLLRCGYGIEADINAKRPDQFLGIRKERVKRLIEKGGDLNVLKVMQMEKRMDEHWTEEQIDHIAEAGLRREQIEGVTVYMSVQQLLNRIKKYAGVEWGTGCGSAEQILQNVANRYIDYLNMRIALGYDLNNSVYQQPRDLNAAHAKMVTESNQREADKRIQETEQRFPMIRKNYRKLRRKYYFEDESFFIRPARSAKEIVMEGRILHHCVGGDGYLRKHNRGETYILMLRQQSCPEIPYITVEIDAMRERIIQWYGAHDKKPDKENMQGWLDRYLTRLKCGNLETDEEADEEADEAAEMPLLQIA